MQITVNRSKKRIGKSHRNVQKIARIRKEHRRKMKKVMRKPS